MDEVLFKLLLDGTRLYDMMYLVFALTLSLKHYESVGSALIELVCLYPIRFILYAIITTLPRPSPNYPRVLPSLHYP